MKIFSFPFTYYSLDRQTGAAEESASNSRRSSAMDDRRPSLRRVDQESLLKVRRDSKSRRPSLADVIPDWPALHKVKKPEKVKLIIASNDRNGHLIKTIVSRMFCQCMSMSLFFRFHLIVEIFNISC